MSQAVGHQSVSSTAALRAELAHLPAYVEPPRTFVQHKSNWTAIITILAVLSVTGLCLGLQFYVPSPQPAVPVTQIGPEQTTLPPMRQHAFQDVPLPEGVHLHAPLPVPRTPAHAVRQTHPSNG